MAAEQGHIDAQYKLAECYRLGIGIEKDEVKAHEWHKKAEAQGNKDAQSIIISKVKNSL